MVGSRNPGREFFRLCNIVVFGIAIPSIVCAVDIAYIDMGQRYALLLNFE